MSCPSLTVEAGLGNYDAGSQYKRVEMMHIPPSQPEMQRCPLGQVPPVRAIMRYTSEAPPPLIKALLPCKEQHFQNEVLYVESGVSL